MQASYLDGRKIVVDGRDFTYFYGTSYLGMPYDDAFKRFIRDGQNKYGSSLGSSPLSSPQLDIYHQLEACLANQYGFDRSLLFASGYAAAQTVVEHYRQLDFSIEYGNIAHPALKLEKKLLQKNESEKSKQTLHAIDFIDPITFELGDQYKAEQQGDLQLIDASHGFGLFDESLKSLSHQQNTLICGSLNKALGINAGIVLGSKSQIENLKNTSRYKTSSAPSPAECFALLHALENGLVTQKKIHLSELTQVLSTVDRIRVKAGFPAIIFRDNSQELYEHFKSDNLLIWRNHYPTKQSSLVNRAVITASHHHEDVSKLINSNFSFTV